MKKISLVVLRVVLSVVALLFIVFGILGIRDHLWHLLIVGVITLFITIFWNVFKSRSDKTGISPLWKKCRSLIVGILIAYALIDVGLITAGVVAAQSDFSEDENLTVVVLGTDVDGDQPGDLLKPRLDTAATYLKEHPESKVIVTGKGRGEYTEAEVMHQYLVKVGIGAERIYQEDRAQSTKENFIFSKEIIQAENFSEQILSVTNNYHQMRASMYAEQNGINVKTLSAPTTWYMLFPLSERERYIILTEWLGLTPDLVNKYQEI
ncbi:YdcF family protein [Radiobacillus sp. PE A8.2]